MRETLNRHRTWPKRSVARRRGVRKAKACCRNRWRIDTTTPAIRMTLSTYVSVLKKYHSNPGKEKENLN